MAKTLQLSYFPEEVIQLNQEITHHPKLMEQLAGQEANEFEVRLACICAYCEIIVNGVYTNEAIVNLAKICLKKLQHKRSGNLIDISSTVTEAINNESVKH